MEPFEEEVGVALWVITGLGLSFGSLWLGVKGVAWTHRRAARVVYLIRK